jgi:methionine-rich copper-binding protein CopC
MMNLSLQSRLFTTLMICAVGGITLNAWAQNVKVKPVGIAVVSESFAADEFEFGPLNGMTGTSVSLMVETSEGFIVDIDTEASELTSFADSTGRNLLEAVPGKPDDGWVRSGIDSFPKMSKSGSQALVEIAGPRSPAVDAESMTIQGKLSIITAKGTKSFKTSAESLTAKPRKAGDYSFEISNVEEQEMFGEKALEVTLEFQGDLAKQFSQAKFTDSNGQPIEAQPSMTMSFNETKQVSYSLKTTVDTVAAIELELYQELDTSDVRLDLSIPVGGLD